MSLLQTLKDVYQRRINEMEQELALIDAQINSAPIIPVQPAQPPVNPGIPHIPGLEPTDSGGSTIPVTVPPQAPAGYEGHDLVKGQPRINVEYAGSPGIYRFNGPGTVYYQVAAGTDSGMRVSAWITRADGTPVWHSASNPDTRVISNKQPMPQVFAGDYLFYVQPEQTGPISVGLE